MLPLQGHRFHLWSGNWDPTCRTAWPKRKSPKHNNKNTYTYTLIKQVNFKKVENTTKQLESKDSEIFQTHGSKESEYLQVTTKLDSELSAHFLLLSAPPVFRSLVPHPHSLVPDSSSSWETWPTSSLPWLDPHAPTPPCSDTACHRCVTALALWTSPPEGHPMGALWMVRSVTLFHSWSTKWTLQSSLN